MSSWSAFTTRDIDSNVPCGFGKERARAALKLLMRLGEGSALFALQSLSHRYSVQRGYSIPICKVGKQSENGNNRDT